MAELADALASGASVLIGRAGSSPAPGTLSSCTNCYTRGHKLERVCDLWFLCFSELERSRIVSVGIYILNPVLSLGTSFDICSCKTMAEVVLFCRRHSVAGTCNNRAYSIKHMRTRGTEPLPVTLSEPKPVRCTDRRRWSTVRTAAGSRRPCEDGAGYNSAASPRARPDAPPRRCSSGRRPSHQPGFGGISRSCRWSAGDTAWTVCA